MAERTDARLDRLLGYEEIRQLVARYAVATDARDLDALVALFVDDVQVGRHERGRAALRAFFDRSLRDVGITILNTGTHMIDFVGDAHAQGIVYCRGEIQVGNQWVVQAIQYRDDYELRDGHWYFTRRRHLLWYGREVGTSPLGLAPADWPAHHTGTGELPDVWPTWQQFWAVPPATDGDGDEAVAND